METGNLNLARKWRSKNFDQIVGQDLSVKMLKNSLYLDRFFPVYLFSGQRGCGKTTTARVFAAAINCERLEAFRKNPRAQMLPCNMCDSCKAMLAGKHPDFIEMDAASHTGVDNVRNIVDAASLLPVMGNKKIYLIDEAHMLSKAAFNAFLKILEEPPSSVLFILATTDADKIIDTVKSRCFQLFFRAVKDQPLLHHLNTICSDESIKAEDDALSLIIKETDGSVRDAINVLERVRFSSAAVTKKAVRAVLGHLDDEQIIRMLEAILHKTPADLIMYFKDLHLETVEASFVWRRMTDLLRTAIWLKNGVQTDEFSDYTLQIKEIIRTCSWTQLNHMLSQLYANEDLFKRTTAQHSFLEMILLGFCQKYSSNDTSSSSSSSSAPAQAMPSIADEDEEDEFEDDEEYEDEDEDEEDEEDDEEDDAWSSFIQEVSSMQDPLLTSIFKQAQLVEHKKDEKNLKVLLSKELQFFSDWIADTEHLWRPVLEKHFGAASNLDVSFALEKKVLDKKEVKVVEPVAVPKVIPKAAPQQVPQRQWQQRASQTKSYQTPRQPLGEKIGSNELAQFTHAAMIMRHFPGDLYQLHES